MAVSRKAVTVTAATDVIEITLSMAAEAHTAGDIMADTQEIAGAARINGGKVILQSVCILDEDDQGAALDLIFLNAATSLGTEGSAVSISDANARNIIGAVSVVASDYVDLINSQVATVRNIGLLMEATAATTSLYVGVVTRGTPTPSATGMRIKLAFLQD